MRKIIGLREGVLIVFEGIDGAGKTTQAERLLSFLQEKGYPAVYFREPSDSKWGLEIKRKALEESSLSPEQELGLFQKDRRENVENNLKPALADRKIVILDRYYFSTIAYQGAKGIDPQKIREMNEVFAPMPDIVFVFDIEAQRGLKRIEDRGQKDMLFEREEYLVKVQEIFNILQGENIHHIDARKSIETVAAEIKHVTLTYLSAIF